MTLVKPKRLVALTWRAQSGVARPIAASVPRHPLVILWFHVIDRVDQQNRTVQPLDLCFHAGSLSFFGNS